MATQEEVIRAFGNFENSPRRASNFEMVVLDDDYTAYLVGDDRVVYAKREPLRRVELWSNRFGPWDSEWTDGDGISHQGLSNQHRRVKRTLRDMEMDEVDGREHHNERPKYVHEVDDL